MNGHGGKRVRAGKPRTRIDEKRVLSLVSQKIPRREIAARFGVGIGVINYFLKKQRNN